MKETNTYVGIGASIGLLVGQLLAAVSDWNNKGYLCILLGIFVGMRIGAIADKAVNQRQKPENDAQGEDVGK